MVSTAKKVFLRGSILLGFLVVSFFVAVPQSQAQAAALASGAAPVKCGPLPLAAGCHLTTPHARKPVTYSGRTVATPLGATCSGNGCNGLDPYYQSNCGSDFWTVQGLYAPDGKTYLELEWSPLCGTNWAQLYNADPWGAITALSASVARQDGPDGYGYGTSFFSYQYSWINTNMVYAPHNLAHACQGLISGGTSDDTIYCTGWH